MVAPQLESPLVQDELMLILVHQSPTGAALRWRGEGYQHGARQIVVIGLFPPVRESRAALSRYT